MAEAGGGQLSGPSRAYDLSVGQIAEWLVWTHLVASSLGDLHVFLPLKDQGIDGIVHRISTDSFARVQVKGRHRFENGIYIDVTADELIDERARIVAVEVNQAGTGLGATAFLVDVPTFRARASPKSGKPQPVYQGGARAARGLKREPSPLCRTRSTKPKLSVAGSLSAVLWLRVARRHGAVVSPLVYRRRCYFARRLAMTLIIVATTTTPNRYDSSAWRRAGLRMRLVLMSVSETWKVIPMVKAT